MAGEPVGIGCRISPTRPGSRHAPGAGPALDGRVALLGEGGLDRRRPCAFASCEPECRLGRGEALRAGIGREKIERADRTAAIFEIRMPLLSRTFLRPPSITPSARLAPVAASIERAGGRRRNRPCEPGSKKRRPLPRASRIAGRRSAAPVADQGVDALVGLRELVLPRNAPGRRRPASARAGEARNRPRPTSASAEDQVVVSLLIMRVAPGDGADSRVQPRRRALGNDPRRQGFRTRARPSPELRQGLGEGGAFAHRTKAR